jgi:transposase-like protein
MQNVTGKNLREVIAMHVSKDSNLMTDSFRGYKGLKTEYASHETVNHHAKEYVRGKVYTNTVESYFSLLKRGINGTFHHISKEHLSKYLAEFDFRYNYRSAAGFSDIQRTARALAGIGGKRLMYRDPGSERKACTAK